MGYDAVDIARHIVVYCNNKEKPITNLKLQKLLYYIWIEYYKKCSGYLFDNNICAWQFGPVVPEVYYEYCMYAGMLIRLKQDSNVISYADLQIVDSAIDRYIDYSASELVEMTHRTGSPWSKIFRQGVGNREIIPFENIINGECRDAY